MVSAVETIAVTYTIRTWDTETEISSAQLSTRRELRRGLPDPIESCSDCLLKDVEPKVRYRQAERMKLPRATASSVWTVRLATEYALEKDTLIVYEERIVVPLYDVSQPIRLPWRVVSSN